ncbi:MAG: hypothetical protein ACLQME_12545 [Alphaproteobacteria bacterium]
MSTNEPRPKIETPFPAAAPLANATWPHAPGAPTIEKPAPVPSDAPPRQER